MATNLELKIKVKDFKPIISNLKKIKAIKVKVLNQKDIYYKNKNGLRKLRIENGEESFIQYVRDEKGKDRFSDYDVLRISSQNSEEFFDKFLTKEVVVEKIRTLYMFDNTRIHLDEVKGLGKFLELETLVLNGKQDAKKRFSYIFEALELRESKEIKKSYRDLKLKG
ncbi:MAG TPA: class IV adenylate cyclase [Ignavibacteriaceae bacterium]|nr:class IV adenylate cyclase [Ignavibacteriaceae bacterium]